jgi:hypothetical protein
MEFYSADIEMFMSGWKTLYMYPRCAGPDFLLAKEMARIISDCDILTIESPQVHILPFLLPILKRCFFCCLD